MEQLRRLYTNLFMETLKINQSHITNYLKLSSQLNRILEGVVNCRIIESKAAEFNLEPQDEELQQAADDFRLTHNLQNIKSTMEWMEANHLTIDDFEALIRTNVISKKLAKHLFNGHVEKFFYQNHLDYTGAAIYEVVLDDEDLAIELYCALQEGEISFHDVVRKYESNDALRRSGGYLGVVKRQSLKPEISAAVFTASPPELLKPILTSMGAHLILVEETIQPNLNEQLKTEIMSALFANWLKQQLEDTKIDFTIENGLVSETLRT